MDGNGTVTPPEPKPWPDACAEGILLSDASSDQPIVAVIHSSPGTVGPANLVFTERFPEARPRHLLDLRLCEPGPAEGISAASRELVIGLITDAIDHGAEGVLLCTSSFGPVAHGLAGDLPVPVLAPDETMFAHVDALRPARVAVLGPQQAGPPSSVPSRAARQVTTSRC